MTIRRLLLVVLLGLFLAACSDSTDQAASGSKGAPVESLETLRERFAGAELTVLDVSEREWQGKNAIAVTLSVPLDPKSDFQRFLAVSQRQGATVDGAWILADDRRSLYFPASAPRTDYEVTVHRGLPALTGAELKESVTRQLTTRDVRPAVGFASEGSVLPAHLTNGIPITAINVKEVNIDFHRLDPKHIADFTRHLSESYQNRFYRYDQLRGWGTLAYSGRFDLNPPDNTLVKQSIPVEDIPELQEPGFYVAVMDEAGDYDYRRYVTYFVVTDIGLHARQYPGELVVLASSLADGSALDGISVAIMDAQGNVVQERETSPEGEARFNGDINTGSYLLARSGKQIALLQLQGPALDLSEFDLGNRPQLPQEAFVYTPRDLYRPGETVDFSALLRDGDGFMVQNQPLNIEIHQPDGQIVQQALLQPQDMAYYLYRFTLPGNAARGNWRFDVTNLVGGNTSYAFKVEDFLPERMALTFNDGQQEPLQFDAAEPVRIPVKGMYLYGAPASGNRLSGTAQVSLLREALPQYKGYLFGDETEAQAAARFDLPDQFLDEAGNTIVNIDSRWASIHSPLQIQLVSSLYETGGRPVVRSYRARVWPGNIQFGVRPSFAAGKNPPSNSVVDFDLVQVDAEGALQAASGVQVNLVREDRQYYWEYNDNEGWHYQFTEKEYVERSQTLALQAQTGANKISFNVDWGRYRLEVKDPSSGAVTTVRFHAGEDWYADWQESQRADKSVRPDIVTLALDKAAYKPGDVAKLQVNSPHAGEALIMVESNQPLWLKRVHMDQPQATVDIPIAAEWNRHDIHVSAVVLRPASRKEQITPNRAFGLVHLPLDRSDRKLTLELKAPEKMQPDTDLRSEITVLDTAGNPFANGYVTLAAVDVGVLNISEFKTPDPVAGFFGRRRYSVDSRDIYGNLIELNDFAKAKIRFGGDADLARGGKEPDSDVQIVSLFNAPVKLDDQGKAQVDLPIPYFNGKVRVMALAFGESKFASAEQETTIAAPLVTYLGLPRFLALGDTATAAFDLHNMTGMAQNLKVEISTGAGLETSTMEKTVALEADRKTTLPFTIKGDNLQQGSVKIRVAGDGFTAIEREWKIGLRPAYPAEIRMANAILDPGAAFTVPSTLFKDLHGATAEMLLSVGNKANLNLPVHIRDLLHYPYGCLEQTSSSAYPYALATEQNQARFNMTPVTAQQRAERIDVALTRIAGMQASNGGFGLWDDTSPEEHWLTVYVTDFMLNVQEQGFSVPPAMLEKALNRLTEYVNRTGSLFEQRYTDDMDHYRFSYKAYAGYVLARLNKAPLASLRTLHDQFRSQSESGLPLLHLGIALQLAGDQSRADVAINEALVKVRSEKNYLADYGSLVRDQAMMIYLLLKHQIHTEHALTLSYSLAADLKQAQWLSTQERNALFMAGVMLESTTGESWMAKLRVGEADELLTQSGNAYRKFEGDTLQKSIQVSNTGNGRLFASAQVSGYPLTKPTPVEDQGYRIRRQYFSPEGKAMQLSQVRGGDLVLVHLEVDSDTIAPESLIVDMLPAGFELENQNLEHAVKLTDFRIDGKTLQELQGYAKVMHQEYRDDRYVAALDVRWDRGHLFYLMRAVTPGDYRVPPPYVEDMYRAQRRGVGVTTDSVKVLPR